jgi:hypothetical protein
MITREQIQTFAAAWYRALDAHARIDECFRMLAGESLHMRFPDAEIRDYATFRRWYGYVTQTFFDEKHELLQTKMESSTENEAEVKIVVNWRSAWWKAPAAIANKVDLIATQTWTVRTCSSSKNMFGLEIVDYNMEDPEYALESAKLPPSDADDVKELIDLNDRIGEAEKTRDAEFLRSILSDNLRFRRANGTIVDKSIYLDDLMKPANTTDELESDQIVPTITGSLAVVTLVVRVSGMRSGNKLDGSFRNVRIFLNEPDKRPHWQLHSWFNLPVAAEHIS